MEIIGRYGKKILAILTIAKINSKIVEFVESLQPPFKKEEKWVLIISTLYGCPMKCLMCDAGSYYEGLIDKKGLFEQIFYMIKKSYPNLQVTSKKFKIQFARMGEPSLNPAVLEVIEDLSTQYNFPNLIPCISTIAPRRGQAFLYQLCKLKNEYYSQGKFQLQFSIHSSDEKMRRTWMPQDIWSLKEIHEFGEQWYRSGDRKITLNFAVGQKSLIIPSEIYHYFNPVKYIIKLTPVNPTEQAKKAKIQSKITPQENISSLVKEFEQLGFKCILSIGEWEENLIGSNCGQFASYYNKDKVRIRDEYQTSKYLIQE